MLEMTLNAIVEYFEAEARTYTNENIQYALLLPIDSLKRFIKKEPELHLGEMRLKTFINMMVTAQTVNGCIDDVFGSFEILTA